jgi:mRNA-degrading endonuclease RelE of RelBE toxin-antitoxin system
MHHLLPPQTQQDDSQHSTAAEDPGSLANQVKKLTDHSGYQQRVGDWRVVYTVSAEAITINVIRLAPRGGAYQ